MRSEKELLDLLEQRKAAFLEKSEGYVLTDEEALLGLSRMWREAVSKYLASTFGHLPIGDLGRLISGIERRQSSPAVTDTAPAEEAGQKKRGRPARRDEGGSPN